MTGLGEHYPGHHAAIRPEAPALIDGTTSRTVSYRELDSDAWRIAQFFRSIGLKSGDTIALCVENSLEYVELIWGAHYAGLVYTPVSTKLKANEVEYIVRNSGARVLLLSSALAPDSRSALESALPDVRIIEIEVGGGLPLWITAHPATPLPKPTEGMALLYSSGTTGKPKGIRPELPGNILGHNPSPIGGLLGHVFGLVPSSVYLSPAPLFHAAPLGYVLAAGQIGATAVVMGRFQASDFLTQIGRYKVTHTQVVPTMFSRLLALPAAEREAANLSSLECLIHAAAPCPESIKRAMFDWLGPIIHEYYSGSEGFGFVYCSPQDWLSHPQTVGRSLLGPVHIVDDDGNEVPIGDEGVIYFESPRRIEYIGDPEKTSSAFNDRGWGTFGDVGRVDADGYVYITDRRTDLIITGGVNVYPREVEDVLITHPGVVDAAVIGLPDADLGQRVTAVVSLTDQVAESPHLAEELVAHCRAALSHVKCPREVQFVAEMPRTETGKLLRRELRDTAKASAMASGAEF